MSLHRQAANLASKGRKGDSVLVHMTPKEVAGLNGLALSLYGKPLTVNPKTGLVEANLLKQYLGTIVGGFAGAMGFSAPVASILGGLASGAANGWNLKNVGLGSLQGWSGRELGAKLNTMGAKAAPTTAPVTSPPAGATTVPPEVASQFGIVENTPVTPNAQATQAANAAVQQAAATTATPVKVEPAKGFEGLKQTYGGLKAIMEDPKKYEAFFNSSKLPMGAAFLAGALTPEKINMPKQAALQRLETEWHPGELDPNWQKVPGAPYYKAGTRGFFNNRYVPASQPIEPNYWWLRAPGAARGGLIGLASGGATPTEQPIKTPPPDAVQTPAPVTPDPRLSYTSPYSGTTYKSPYADDLAAYIDKVNASFAPAPRTSTGTGTETGTGTGTRTGDAAEPNVPGPTPPTMPPMVAPPTMPGTGTETGTTTGTGTGTGTAPSTATGNGGTVADGAEPTSAVGSGGGGGGGGFGGSSGGSRSGVASPADISHVDMGRIVDAARNYISLGFDAQTAVQNAFGRVLGSTFNLIPGIGGYLANLVQALANPSSVGLNTIMHPGTYNPQNTNRVVNGIGNAIVHGNNPISNWILQQWINATINNDKNYTDAPAPPTPEEKVSDTNTMVASGGGSGNGFGGGVVGGGLGFSPGGQRAIVEVEDVKSAAHGGLLGRYAGGGGIGSLGAYSDGGGRFLRGPGDGVSDDIPAEIYHPDGKKQPARLATGEFVLPARFVSEMGNGDSAEGAKRLYAVMDAVQKDRKRTIKNIAEDTNAVRHFKKYMA